MAEAFQMPLAEATAAGLPVIAPAGGAAEEVVDPSAAVFVAATIEPRSIQPGVLIRADTEALVGALEAVLTNTSQPAWRAPSRGPLWAARKLSMAHAADAVLAEVMKRVAEEAEPGAEQQCAAA